MHASNSANHIHGVGSELYVLLAKRLQQLAVISLSIMYAIYLVFDMPKDEIWISILIGYYTIAVASFMYAYYKAHQKEYLLAIKITVVLTSLGIILASYANPITSVKLAILYFIPVPVIVTTYFLNTRTSFGLIGMFVIYELIVPLIISEITYEDLILGPLTVGIMMSVILIVSTNVFKNIEERKFKILEESLIRSERIERMEAMSRLSSGIVHDFNNILLAISANLELFTHENSDHTEAINPIIQNVDQGKKITDQLLTMLKEAPENFDFFDLTMVIKQKAQFFEQFTSPQVNLSLNLTTEQLSVYGNQNNFEQVLMNLIINANDAYKDHQGRIDLSTEKIMKPVEKLKEVDYSQLDKTYSQNLAYAKITVQDYGMGIPSHTLSKVFEPFYSTKEKGTGLGLYIVQNHVKNLSGTISINSVVGEGTIISIEIPLTRN